MTELELKGLVDFKYARESQRLDQPTLKFDNGEFSLYYDTIMAEIFAKLGITEIAQDISITPVTVFTEYALGASYGALRNFELIFTGEDATVSRLELVSISELPTAGNNLVSGTPNRIAIYPKNDGLYYIYLYPLSGFTGTLRIRYKVNHDIQAGAGAGADLTKDIPLPIQYKNLLIIGILSQLMPEFLGQYMNMLDEAPYLDALPTKGNIDYNLGGF